MQASSPTRCCTCKFQKWLKSGLKYQNIMNWRPSKTHFNSTSRRFTFARIDISCARFFFYESAEKELSYTRLNCAVFNYFYMSLGQV